MSNAVSLSPRIKIPQPGHLTGNQRRATRKLKWGGKEGESGQRCMVNSSNNKTLDNMMVEL